MIENYTKPYNDSKVQVTPDFQNRFQNFTTELKKRCEEKAGEEAISLELAYHLICLEDLTEDELEKSFYR